MNVALSAALIAISPLCLSETIIAPNGTIELRSGFLHELSQDIVSDYTDLRNAYDIDNYAEVNITDADFARVVIAQEGVGNFSGNKVKLSVSSSNNTVLVGQKGVLNTAFVQQDGQGNTALIGQLGMNNEALIVQEGDNNVAMIGQLNAFNTANKVSIEQSNDNNLAIVSGTGGVNLGVSQDGGDLFLLETSSALHIYVDQSN